MDGWPGLIVLVWVLPSYVYTKPRSAWRGKLETGIIHRFWYTYTRRDLFLIRSAVEWCCLKTWWPPPSPSEDEIIEWKLRSNVMQTASQTDKASRTSFSPLRPSDGFNRITLTLLCGDTLNSIPFFCMHGQTRLYDEELHTHVMGLSVWLSTGSFSGSHYLITVESISSYWERSVEACAHLWKNQTCPSCLTSNK